MAVKPMAGTARMVPAIRPLRSSCAISRGTSGDFQQLELALLGLLVAELRVQDVADRVEVARPARAVEVDLLALREPLQPLHRALHARATALRDLSHVIADGGPRRFAFRMRDGQRDEADVIVGLARVRVEIVVAERLREALVRGRLDG